MLHQAIVDREELGESLNRFLPGGVAEMLRRDGRRAGETVRMVVTVLMSDIRSYSTIAEHADPTVLAAQLNAHRAEMNRAVFEVGGTVMQLIGDAVMAVFGAPLPQDDHADRALAAAAAMHARQAVLNQAWAAESLPPFELGIGLSTGEVAAAMFGSDERLDYTVVGDTVNLAAAGAAVGQGGRGGGHRGDVSGLTRAARHGGAGPGVGQGKGDSGERVSDSSCGGDRIMIEGAKPAPEAQDVTHLGEADDGGRVLEAIGVRKTYESEGLPVRALRGVDLDAARRRVRGHHGPVGLRQVDPVEPRRRARHPDRRRDRRGRGES